MKFIGKCFNKELATRQNASFLDALYANISDGIAIYDKNGAVSYVNKRLLEIFGIETDRNTSGVTLFNDPNTPTWVIDKIKAGENVDYELVYDFSMIEGYQTSINGTKILLVKVQIIRDTKGAIEYYLEIYEDITLKKRNADLLTETTIKMSKLLNFVMSGIEIYDRDGVMVDCNDYERIIFGLKSKEAFLKQRLNIFNNPNLTEGHINNLKNGQDFKFEL